MLYPEIRKLGMHVCFSFLWWKTVNILVNWKRVFAFVLDSNPDGQGQNWMDSNHQIDGVDIVDIDKHISSPTSVTNIDVAEVSFNNPLDFIHF